MTTMRPGQPVLRFFDEAELAPDSAHVEKAEPSVTLLREAELKDLKAFAEEFSQDAEVILPSRELAHRAHLTVFISICAALGAVSLRKRGDGVQIRSSGRLGRHVPQILGIYLENAFTMIENWNSIHLIPEDSVSALELLHQLELRRIKQEKRAGRMARPLAERPVAFAVFHAKNADGESCYLFEFNKDWRRLNFIGGKQEPVDRSDYAETVKREISEELGIRPGRIALTRLNEQPLVGYSLSGNAGSLARYPCVLLGGEQVGHLAIMNLHPVGFESVAEPQDALVRVTDGQPGYLVSSGRYFHYYGATILAQGDWLRFLAQFLMPCVLVSPWYVGHSLYRGFCALRLTATPPHKPTLPHLVGTQRPTRQSVTRVPGG